jgi:ABC-2 type transport system ATP-binding protein
VSVWLATERAGGAAHGPHRSGPPELAGLRRRCGRLVALDGLSFTVEPGRIFGFPGPSGAGKTTAVRIAMGTDPPGEGTVRWGGRLLTRADWLAFGYMPEQRCLYPKMRVRDHPADLARRPGLTTGHAAGACDRWLRRAGSASRPMSGSKALSHGNQQRIQLAAVLVYDSQILVLDEPFSGLDLLGITDMAEVLEELARAGVRVVFSSYGPPSTSARDKPCPKKPRCFGA